MIPLPKFFAKPPKDQLRISPLGTWLGYRQRDPSTGVLNVWVQHVSSQTIIQLTFQKTNDACLLFWFSYDDKSLILLTEYLKSGSELYHLHAIDLPTGSLKSILQPTPRDLIPSDMTCAMGFAGGLQVWLDPANTRQIYTAVAPLGIRSLFWSVARIHLDTCQLTIVEQNPLATWMGLTLFVLWSGLAVALHKLRLTKLFHIPKPRATLQWFPDRFRDFRGRLDISLVDLSCAWSVRDTPQNNITGNNHQAHEHNIKKWKTLYEVEWKDANMSLVGSTGGSGTAHIEFSPDNQSVDLHVCNMKDTTTYERFDIATGQHLQQLAHHPTSDITGFVRHPWTHQVEAVRFHYEKPTIQPLPDCPEDVKKDIEFLQEQFAGASISIGSRTVVDTTWVIFVQSDVGLPACDHCPSGYFLFHRISPASSDGNNNGNNKKRKLEFLWSPQSDLASQPLGTMTPVHIPTRDGQSLLCYWSRPPSSITKNDAISKTPLVLLIHGGPQARDYWQFHPVCQLLTNRGMSVLQVNYRGSTGMGTNFMKIGMNGAFASGVQEDIQDAANYAVEQKWCAPDKIAIMGGSFGGYSSLAAMTFMAPTPKAPLFQCAVAICPPSMFGAANPHKAFYGNPVIARYWRQVFGHAISANVQASQRISPMFHTDKVTRPVLLLHGEDDPRVPMEQTNEFFRKLQQRTGVEDYCEYVRFAKEGHGIKREQNQLFMYHQVERFLCKHLQLPKPPVLEDSWIVGHTGTSISAGSAMNCDTTSCKDKRQ